MAEGFAKKYGADVIEAKSAGLSPAAVVQPLTFQVMEEKNIKLEGHAPKDLSAVSISDFDLLVNMSGVKLPSRIPLPIREWKVEDPIGRSEEVYRQIRDQIEDLTMRLILELRREQRPNSSATRGGALTRLGRRLR